jgi:hypothetical protein
VLLVLWASTLFHFSGIERLGAALSGTAVLPAFVAILFFIVGLSFAVFLWWIVGRYFSIISSGKLTPDQMSSLKDLPVGMPERTIRAILALIVGIIGLPLLLFQGDHPDRRCEWPRRGWAEYCGAVAANDNVMLGRMNSSDPSVQRRSQLEFLTQITDTLSAGIIELPAFPQVVIQVQEAYSNPNYVPQMVARLISAEPTLARRLLDMANSVAFNTTGRVIIDLGFALTRLGAQKVYGVVMCALSKVHRFSGCNPHPATLAPAGSTWSGPGGDKWPEALQENPSVRREAQRAGRNGSEHRAGLENVNAEADSP